MERAVCAAFALAAAFLTPLMGLLGYAKADMLGLGLCSLLFLGCGIYMMWQTGRPDLRGATAVCMVLMLLLGYDFINR